VLGPEGERRPLELASLESALSLQFGVVGVSGPPTLEEIFVPSARGPPPKAASVLNKLDWVLNKPGSNEMPRRRQRVLSGLGDAESAVLGSRDGEVT